jgi:hypothetical protein
VRADGIEFPATLLPSLWGHSSEQGYAAIIRDISVRKALEREREHARTFLDSVVANLPAMLFVRMSTLALILWSTMPGKGHRTQCIRHDRRHRPGAISRIWRRL